jgi:hypothetical protein
MAAIQTDSRSPSRRAQDEAISAEPHLLPPEFSNQAVSSPVEAHLHRSRRHPRAIAGVVENGVRLLDPTVKLTEHSRDIVVAEGEKHVITERMGERAPHQNRGERGRVEISAVGPYHRIV